MLDTVPSLPASCQPDTSDGMSLADLDRLRRALPGCEVAMLADLSTVTVLGASAALPLPQERHDSLCQEARRVLERAELDRAELDSGPTGAAALVTRLGIRLFLRAPGHPEEVLCLVLAPRTPLAPVLRRAHAALGGGLHHG